MPTSSFEADDGGQPRLRRDDAYTTPSSPGISTSQLSTPIISHRKALSLILKTPPTAENHTPLNTGYPVSNIATTLLPFPSNPSQSQHTPSIFNSSHHDSLEPPAWKPPESDEIEYTDTWNNTHNNQHHYLQPMTLDDSTIGSNQTNKSFVNNSFSASNNSLRPRGLSLCSYSDAPSVGSVPQAKQENSNHRRNPSLPLSFFSSALQPGGSNQQLFTPSFNSGNQLQINKQYLNALQSSPHELHSHHNPSQVKADGAMAGLDGVLLDLYIVDRSVDSASAKMLAIAEGTGFATPCDNEKDRNNKGNKKNSSSQKPRQTALGTRSDIECILELYKVDKIVDRFKKDLQMPEFFEEETRESAVWKDLRKTDVEMEEHARKKKPTEGKGTGSEGHRQGQKVQYQIDLTDDSWKREQRLGGEGIYSTAEAPTNTNDYDFFNPHESDALQANCYQSSQVSDSIHDDLHEMIDLLRIDVAVDGASRRHHEIEMIQPLLETDRLMNKWKEHSEIREMWVGDLKALHLTDLEVDRAKRKSALNHKKVGVEKNSADMEGEPGNHSTKQPNSVVAPVESTKECTNQAMKDALSQHIPESQQKCLTSPELKPREALPLAADFALSPPAPLSPQQPKSIRAIFSTQEKISANMMPKVAIGTTAGITATKRSIFSRQEKTSAKSQCAFQRGIMMPGTTTIVMADEMIDGIPVGKVLMR